MGALTRAGLRRLLPDTLFGRLAALLMSVALLSHVLALTAMFELMPRHGAHPGAAPSSWAGLNAGVRSSATERFDAPPYVAFDNRHGGPPGPHMLPPGTWLDIGVRLSALAIAAWFAAAWIARPVRRLAAATQALGQGLNGPMAAPLPDEGPRELREASLGFNRMQERIVGHLRERDRFVAAVSHDLRTPLTRLRLRAEDLSDAAQQADFQRDIAEMEAMIAATLDCFRGGARGEVPVRLDVQSLAETLAEDQRACGHDVQCAGIAAPLSAAPCALKRCIGNLVDNAVRYGGTARITLLDAPDCLVVEVLDAGPGIAEAEIGQVLQPFCRVETSRNRHSGGVGLGLAIAGDIARQHGGTLVLRNAKPQGLLASLRLPR